MEEKEYKKKIKNLGKAIDKRDKKIKELEKELATLRLQKKYSEDGVVRGLHELVDVIANGILD